MSSFEQDPKDQQSGDASPPAQPTIFTQAPQVKTHSKWSYWLSYKTGGIVLVGALIVLYSMLNFKNEDDAALAQLVPVKAFDERLLACNELMTSAPSAAYDSCLAAAQDGQILAIKRLIWAYSRKSDSQDLGKVFDWLRALPYKDDATQLLMFSLVHLNTQSDSLRKDSEAGITRLVAKNYAPANVVLASIYALSENVTAPTSNTLWLLNRANAKDPMTLDAALLATIYANGFVSKVDIAAASAALQHAADTNFPMMTNNIAWFLATLDTNPFVPSDYAVNLATRVVDDPVHGQNHIYVDTLAAALAADKQFEEAIKVQHTALSLLAGESYSENVMLRTQKEYENRLALYANEQILTEASLTADKATFFKSIRNRVLEYVLRDFYIPIESPVTLTRSPDLVQGKVEQVHSQ